MIDRTEPILNLDEARSAAWQKLKAYIEQRINSRRAKNDGDKSEYETAKIRGGIAELKSLIEAVEPAQYKTRKD